MLYYILYTKINFNLDIYKACLLLISSLVNSKLDTLNIYTEYT